MNMQASLRIISDIIMFKKLHFNLPPLPLYNTVPASFNANKMLNISFIELN